MSDFYASYGSQRFGTADAVNKLLHRCVGFGFPRHGPDGCEYALGHLVVYDYDNRVHYSFPAQETK